MDVAEKESVQAAQHGGLYKNKEQAPHIGGGIIIPRLLRKNLFAGKPRRRRSK